MASPSWERHTAAAALRMRPGEKPEPEPEPYLAMERGRRRHLETRPLTSRTVAFNREGGVWDKLTGTDARFEQSMIQ